jgi:hypothetical protein
MALTGLMINIKTIPLNEKIRLTKKQIQALQENNQKLYLTIQENTSLANIEQIAITKLNMKPTKKMQYISLENED